MTESTKKNTNATLCRLFLFLLLILISVSGYFLYERASYNTKTCINRIAACEEKLDSGLSNLQSEIANVKVAMSNNNVVSATNFEHNLRQRWKVWLALREKLLTSQNVDSELKMFNEVFEKDNELIKLVSDLCREYVANDDSRESVFDRLLRKIIKINKIDSKAIHIIDGYVLSFR